MVPFGDGDVDDLWDAHAVACVGDEDVWAWLGVGLGEGGEEVCEGGFGGHVCVVGGEALGEFGVEVWSSWMRLSTAVLFVE